MYKYVFSGPGAFNIKTPQVNDISEIKTNMKQFPDHIESHFEYPNGLILDTITYANKIEYSSNKRLIVAEDCSIIFEE
jgi:hypothetical protein